MAQHKSALKRARASERREERNKTAVSRVKTLVKKVYSTKDKEQAEKALKEAVSTLDKTASKGRIHKNNASHKKAALTKYVNSLSADKK